METVGCGIGRRLEIEHDGLGGARFRFGNCGFCGLIEPGCSVYIVSDSSKKADGKHHMKRIFAACLVLLAAVAAGVSVPAYALTPSQSATLAARARADALAKAKAQAAAKARSDALATANAGNAAKSKVVAITRKNVQGEIRRRTEAAEKAAHTQAQIKFANVQLQARTGTPPSVQAQAQKLQSSSKVQTQFTPLGSGTHPRYAQGLRSHASTASMPAGRSKSWTHGR
jgi:hypothetical protein